MSDTSQHVMQAVLRSQASMKEGLHTVPMAFFDSDGNAVDIEALITAAEESAAIAALTATVEALPDSPILLPFDTCTVPAIQGAADIGGPGAYFGTYFAINVPVNAGGPAFFVTLTYSFAASDDGAASDLFVVFDGADGPLEAFETLFDFTTPSLAYVNGVMGFGNVGTDPVHWVKHGDGMKAVRMDGFDYNDAVSTGDQISARLQLLVTDAG